MKVLFVTGSLVHGGAERHTITLSNRLAERGHECHLAYVRNDPSQLSRLRGAASVQCLHAERYLDRDALKRLSTLIARIAPSAVVAVNQHALLYASLARRGSDVPLLVVFHTTWLRTLKEQLKMLAYRPLFWGAEQAVFVCQRQRMHWRNRGVFARRNTVVYNGIDAAYWRPAAADGAVLRQTLGFAAGDYVIGMSAVLRPEKNHVQLVEAVAELRRRGVPARALMVGDGETRPAVETRAQALGVADQVTITGLQQDVRPFLAACDVVALTSHTEAFSLAAIEAMALERPVVHSDVGGAAEMIRPGVNGFLFPVGDTATLVARLEQLAAQDAREHMGKAARALVEQRFTEPAMVERYESILHELETRRSKRANLRRPAGAH